jgi:hypothetical protein
LRQFRQQTPYAAYEWTDDQQQGQVGVKFVGGFGIFNPALYGSLDSKWHYL